MVTGEFCVADLRPGDAFTYVFRSGQILQALCVSITVYEKSPDARRIVFIDGNTLDYLIVPVSSRPISIDMRIDEKHKDT